MTTHKFGTIKYRELANEINYACEWLSDHGLDYPRTRVGEYKRHLNEMADYWEQDRIGDLLKHRDFPTLMNSCHEASELLYIFKGLSSFSAMSVTKKLQEFIKGPTSYTRENSSSSNRGRNIAFELHIAARFATAGFSINLTSDADLIVSIFDHEVFIECKRPQYNHQINSNIKGALRQLEHRYPSAASPSQARGIIAISISKVYNPNLFLLEASTLEALAGKLTTIDETFIDHFDPKWRNPSDSRTIGVMVHLSIPAEIKSQNLLTICHEFAIKTTSPNKRELDLLTEIKDRLHPVDKDKP